MGELFGFVEAYVDCPKSISKPFLPYRDKHGTLIFSTGEFVDVYYTEELKYAKTLGYKMDPLRGYIFKKQESPFTNFVSSMFEKRQSAKKSGNDAMSYVYKILMNSLYGRFGINPKSTITEIAGEDRYTDVLKNHDIIFAEMLNQKDQTYVLSYWSTPDSIAPKGSWKPTRVSAVQLAAAVTACARIHMYQYISREDCYYTDTDSVVLKNPLPNEIVSSIELGKLKLEYKVKKGVFLAPKSYSLITEEGGNILKHKGAAKALVSDEWFENQYKDPSKTETVAIDANFRVDWRTLNILKKETTMKLGIQISSKREPIYEKKTGIWVDTIPLHVVDISPQDSKVESIKYQRRISQLGIAELEKKVTEMSTLLSQEKEGLAKKDIVEKRNVISNLNREIMELRASLSNKDEEIRRLRFRSRSEDQDGMGKADPRPTTTQNENVPKTPPKLYDTKPKKKKR